VEPYQKNYRHMKNFLMLLLGALLLGSCSNAEQQSSTSNEHDHTAAASEAKKKPKSPKQMAMTNVGENHVHIEYSSPSKRGRLIFGGLVGYGEVWVTGAHRATSISFASDVKMGGVDIPAGKYGLFTIPDEEEWTIIINTNWDQHLADDYQESEDVVRVKANATKLNEVVESLTYEVVEIDASTGSITISWDDTSVSFEIKNQS